MSFNSSVPFLGKTLPGFTAIFLLLATESCGTRQESSLRRLAIAPANILIDDDSSGWLKTAIPVILQQDLSAAKATAANVVPSDSAAFAIQATGIAAVTVTRESSGFVVDVVVRDTATQRTTGVFKASAPQDIVAAIDITAKYIDAAAVPFSTHNLTALRAYVDAIGSRDLPFVIRRLQDALSADPHFTAAQTALTRVQTRTASPEPPVIRFRPTIKAPL